MKGPCRHYIHSILPIWQTIIQGSTTHLEKKTKQNKTKLRSRFLIYRKLFLPHSPHSHVGKYVGFGCYVVQRRVSFKFLSLFFFSYNALWFHSMLIASGCAEGFECLALQSLSLNIYECWDSFPFWTTNKRDLSCDQRTHPKLFQFNEEEEEVEEGEKKTKKKH